MLIAAVAAGVVMSAEATGQSLTEEWRARVAPGAFMNTEEDEGVAVVYKYVSQPNADYLFVTGWGTNSFGGVCIVTYRLDPDDGAILHGPVYFPATNPGTVTTQHRPTAMAVDDDGNVYVTGYSRNGNGDFDYILLKYDSQLRPGETFTGWAAVSPDTDGVRRFDGEGEGDDKAVSVVLVECDSTPLVVITGTSRGEDNNDIVTVAYERDDGGLGWTASYNGPGNGNDSAVKMVVVNIASDDDITGPNIFIGGTVLNTEERGFDIVALRYSPCGALIWDLDPPYHNAAVGGGDDICTGVAALGTASGSTTGLVLCGVTPESPASPGRTDYVILGIRLNDGVLSPNWPSVNGAGDGVRIWNPSNEDGAGDDAPTDITIAGSNFAVATGRAGNSANDGGGPYDMGTIAFSIDNGAFVDSDITGEGGKDGIDVRAVSIAGAQEGTSPIVYITGWYHTPFGDTPFYYMTLKYTVNPMVLDAYDFLTGDGFDAKSKRVIAPVAGSSFPGVYITGRHGVATTGVDHLTVKYSP